MALNIDPENLKIFGFWGSILVLKMIAMAPLTARQRLRKQCCMIIGTLYFFLLPLEKYFINYHQVPNVNSFTVFANEEDTMLTKKGKVVHNDPDVERVRRAHLNDVENVVPWFVTTLLWLGTGPSTWLAGLLIRGFVIARILHTIVYAVIPFPQPSRAIVFFVGYFITGYMAVVTLLHYCS